jgi:hypothetical protein
MSRALCVKCGGERTRFDQICPACGHRPDGEGLLIAWLLSDHHLDDKQLAQTQARLRKGESIRPSAKMLDKARRALGQHFTTDEGLDTRQRLGLLATSLLLTPLVGWVLFVWWWSSKPRAAWQALALSLPATVIFTGGVLWAL